MRGITAVSCCALAAVMGLAGTQAGAQTQNVSASQALTGTDFSGTLLLPKFDSSLGTLNAIGLNFSGTLSADMMFENKGTGSATVVQTASGLIVLSRPDSSTLFSLDPGVAHTGTAGAYDHVLDFGGTSGQTLAGLTNTKTGTMMDMLASDLSLFSGAGSIALPLSQIATTDTIAPGKVLSEVDTYASSLLNVTYYYTAPIIPPPVNNPPPDNNPPPPNNPPSNNPPPPNNTIQNNNVADVPEPGSVAMLFASGTCGMGLIIRRKRR